MGWLKQRRCDHMWMKIGEHKYPDTTSGTFYCKYDVFCPYCKKTRKRISQEEFTRLMTIKELELQELLRKADRYK